MRIPFSTCSLVMEDGRIFPLKSGSVEVSEVIPKLENGDFISGVGTVNDELGTAELKSVDFIGLQRLLGLWLSAAGFLDVKNFSSMNFYLNPRYESSPLDQKSFQYSVTPSTGQDWFVFLSDEHSVYFTSVSVRAGTAVMKVYDSETGALRNTLNFSRFEH